jgi:hypothetical protein
MYKESKMFEICVACHKPIWFWQKKGYNSSWHESCMMANEKGYNAAKKFADNECRLHKLPTPSELYGRRGSTGEMLPITMWRNQKQNWVKHPIHEYMANLYPSEETYKDVMNWVRTIAESDCVPPKIDDADLKLVDPYPECEE